MRPQDTIDPVSLAQKHGPAFHHAANRARLRDVIIYAIADEIASDKACGHYTVNPTASHPSRPSSRTGAARGILLVCVEGVQVAPLASLARRPAHLRHGRARDIWQGTHHVRAEREIATPLTSPGDYSLTGWDVQVEQGRDDPCTCNFIESLIDSTSFPSRVRGTKPMLPYICSVGPA